MSWGVYPHATWRVTDHATGGGHPEPTGQGYVAREVTPGVPYGRMTPVRVFKLRHHADKLADKLNSEGKTGRDPRRRSSKSRRDVTPSIRAQAIEWSNLASYHRAVVTALRSGHRRPGEQGVRLVAKWRTLVDDAWKRQRSPAETAGRLVTFDAAGVCPCSSPSSRDHTRCNACRRRPSNTRRRS